MNDRRILSLRFVENLPGEKLTLQVRAGRNGPVDIEITADGARLHPHADALFALGYLPACELQYDLRIEGGVGPELLAKASEIFQLYSGWYGYLRPPKVHAQVRAKPGYCSDRTLLFFSGGVDSCYSLVEARATIQSLVTIVGVDFRPEQREGAEWVARLGRQFAKQFGMRSIVLRTTARRWFDRMVTWDHFHGPFLASIAHLLSPEHGRALVAGSYGAQGLRMAWGSHPDHEHRYSSSVMSLEHHLPHTRLTKVRRLREAGLAGQLRVCLEPVRGSNCGVCRKCTYLRTALRLLTDDAPATNLAFARNDRENFEIRNLGLLEYWSELLALAGEKGEREIVERILKARRKFERRTAWRQRLPFPDFNVSAKRTKRRLRAWSGLLFRLQA